MFSGDKESKTLLNAIKIAESLIKCSNNLINELGKITLTESQRNKRRTYLEFLESTKDLAYKVKYDLIKSAINNKLSSDPDFFVDHHMHVDPKEVRHLMDITQKERSDYMVDGRGRLFKLDKN